MTTRTVQSGSYPQAVRILSDKVLTATDVKVLNIPNIGGNGEETTMYEYTQTEFTKDEYYMWIAEKERSDIDYIAMMADVDLEG